MSGSSVAAACILVFLLNTVFGISCLKVTLFNSGRQNLIETKNTRGLNNHSGLYEINMKMG